MNLTIRPLTPDLWPALEDLFGPLGACNGCWCMYCRIGSEYKRRPRAANKAALREIVRQGPPPGLVAFDGDLAVGWCQLTPRRRGLPKLDEHGLRIHVRASWLRGGRSAHSRSADHAARSEENLVAKDCPISKRCVPRMDVRHAAERC